MAEAMYSVWAIPPEGVTERLKKLMSALRSEFGGPLFEPHITVVGACRLTREDALRRFRAAGGLRPYTARVSAVSRGGFFYQCVYLLVEPTPEVIAASAHCCEHFEYGNATPYMPHLSLIYGDLRDEVKERAVERTKELDGDICGLSFLITTLALYKTGTEDKTLESWEKVAVCDLGGDGVGCQNCSGTLSSMKQRCDSRLLFARQSSTSQACFMQQVSVTQGVKVGSCLQQNSPSSSSWSGIGSSSKDYCGEPMFARPAQAISNIPNLKNHQPLTKEHMESLAEPPRFARPSSGVTSVCKKKQLLCNRTGQTVTSGGGEGSPRMDVAETRQCYVVTLELPGANAIDIKMEVDDKNLTVTGKCSTPRSRTENFSENGNMTYLQRERFQGPYLVIWSLPRDVNKDSVSAELLHGFLQITLPKICGGKADAKL